MQVKKKRPTPKQLPSGNWRCQVRVDGKMVSVTNEDPAVCQAKAMAIQAGAMEKEEKKKVVTLDDAIREYMDSKSNTLSSSTIRGYDQIRWLRFRGIMKRNIHSLTKRDIQVAVNEETKLVSPKSVANAYGLVRPVLKEYGIDVFGVKLPQRIKKKKKYVQREEIGGLLTAAQEDKYEVPILLAIWLGMRRSEICGLCWDCVDEKAKTITVKRKLIMDKDNHFNLVDGAKNVFSQRTIPCPDYIMDKLAAMRHGRTEGIIFRVNPNTILQHIHKVCKEAGITDSTTHGLRHTNAAVMSHLNISEDHALERGGWSEVSTYKKIYSYVFESTATTEDQKIDAFFEDTLK